MSEKWNKLAKFMIRNVGGEGNITEVSVCMTRIRFTLRDRTRVRTELIQQAEEVAAVRESIGEYQVVIGNHVTEVYEAICLELQASKGEKKMSEAAEKKGFGAMLKGLFSGAKQNDKEVVSPFAGTVIALSEVEDEAFSTGIMGNGLAVIPSEGKAFAPVDGVIETFFPTGHAMGIHSDQGVDILIHVGMDTVKLNGEGFTMKAKQGDRVKKGDLLLEFDIDKIKAAGYSIVSPVIITNTEEFQHVEPVLPGQIGVGEKLIQVD